MHEKVLPVGRHPLQLHSLATPNGVKVTVMLEELLALGHAGPDYGAWLIRIGEGDQFGSGFGHFYARAPTRIEHAIDRFAMEAKRQQDNKLGG
jgi:GST-like protein